MPRALKEGEGARDCLKMMDASGPNGVVRLTQECRGRQGKPLSLKKCHIRERDRRESEEGCEK